MSLRVSHETPSPTHSTCLTITQFSWNSTNNYIMFLISYLSHAYQHSIQWNHSLLPNSTFIPNPFRHTNQAWPHTLSKEIINTNIESHQPTQQSLSQHLAQAKGPRPGERVPFAQATPPRLGESATVATTRFQRVLAQATTSRLSETAPRSNLKPVA